jgi:murein hydrolase activator
MMFFIVLAQSNRTRLERKKAIILNKIKETKSQLNETAEIKRKSEKNLSAIQTNIDQKEAKIDVVSEHLDNSSESLIRSYEVVESLNEDILQLREDYGATVRKAFRQRLNHSTLAFLLSSENFNQLSQRFFYIKQIDKYRKRQVELIKGTQFALKSKINRLELRIEKDELNLENIEEQKNELNEKLSEEGEKLTDLQKTERRLGRDLKNQERQAKRLDNIIESAIQNEIIERRRLMQEAARAVASYRSKNDNNEVENTKSTKRKSRKKAQEPEEAMARTTNDDVLRETPEVKAQSDNFRNNKGKLPWPVRKGSIMRGFGRQEHPTLRGIFTINNGVDIKTDDHSDVNSVANGKVVTVQFIVGSDYLVIVQHGSFYTVYSNLERSYVRKGDNISLNQSIGKASNSKVHFEVWSNNSRENPKSWLAKI